MEFKYKVINKLDSLIVNRPFGLFLVLFIPTFSAVSAYLLFNPNALDLKLEAGSLNLGGVLGTKVEEIMGKKKEEESQIPVRSVFEDKLDYVYARPIRLESKRVGLSAQIESIGLDSDGVMETPTSWNRVGWFVGSSKAGQRGNLIINGHYDTNYGGPAVFWVLKNIRVGDTVTVTDKYGRLYDYSVTDSFHIDINDPDRLDVLEDVGEKEILTLITCGGVWVPQDGTYNKRLVVRAELVQEKDSEKDEDVKVEIADASDEQVSKAGR
jgi:LPXTG-site transpeptidase (sortase) family protein